MGKTVYYEVDFENPRPLTDEQRAELKALAAMRDDEIDFSDIPPLDEKFWANAKPLSEMRELRAKLRAERMAARQKPAAQ